MNPVDLIDKTRLPRHIAIIMDGNGRWAKQHGRHRLHGHKNGVKAVREVTEGCAEIGIEFLTLYAFSTENWERPRREVNSLMTLLVQTIKREIKTLRENNIRLNAIGDLQSLPGKCYKELMWAIDETSDYDRMTLTLALSYSSKWEITTAAKSIAEAVERGDLEPNEITEEVVSQHLAASNIPDPELLIRTSGECRVSNFLLWQIAYTELYFTDTLWPDFTKHDLCSAIVAYQKRERRFGKTHEQVLIK